MNLFRECTEQEHPDVVVFLNGLPGDQPSVVPCLWAWDTKCNFVGRMIELTPAEHNEISSFIVSNSRWVEYIRLMRC